MSSYCGLDKAIPLPAAWAASQPFQALLTALLADKDSPGMGFI